MSCGLTALVGPFAWVLGGRAVRKIDAEPGRWSGRDQAKAGYLMGILSAVLLVLAVLALMAYVVFIAVVLSSSP